jgi:hypothetical protein
MGAIDAVLPGNNEKMIDSYKFEVNILCVWVAEVFPLVSLPCHALF